MRSVGRSIFALRGSIAVEGLQDFEAIRARVIEGRAQKLTSESDGGQ